ncbi:hypothetical protein BGZ60DRAFT_419927 [Tricladium varicosporioides]|nr:hypothetical protein BGZ60DRAFT_419927 [Hymenoscyphus varicosporioides]
MESRDKYQSKRLVPFKYHNFPLGSVHASGWLKDQLDLSANGLGGHLFDFYRYVARSTWLGGDSEYSELHESAPYWFNYIVPLAWTLEDQRLKDQARYFLDYVLEHQAPDGWLGPETTRQTRGIWARSLLFFGLIQYAEADPSQTDRIVDAMHKFVTLTHSMLQNNFTGLLQQKSVEDNFDPFGFGVSRTHELPISLMWLYENYPRDNSEVILETINLMFEGGRQGGRDWTTFFVDGVFPKQGTGTFKTTGFTHGVNLAQGLRYPTVLYRITGNESLVKQTRDAVDMTDKYHTSLSGTIIGDEHLGAQSPQRGSELCMSVELMFSYAYLYRFYGSNDFADRAERVAFNALPAAISPDWWSHQYVTQTNQPWSRNLTSVNPFFNVVTYSNTFGLEPNFPCCTVNHPQAYPKYVASAYAKVGDNGIVHMLLGPISVETSISGKIVKVDCNTNYPFSPKLKYTIISETDMKFAIRVPDWASTSLVKSMMQIGWNEPVPLSPDSSNLQNIPIKKGTTNITIIFPMEIRVETRNETVGFYYGPLLYAADIEYEETSHQALNWTDRKPLDDSEVDPRARDHVLKPVSAWQFAVDPSTVAVENNGRENEELPNPVFVKDGPPTALSVDAYPIEWPVEKDTAALPPINLTADISKKMKLKLIPFGAAKLHIAQFPVVKLSS